MSVEIGETRAEQSANLVGRYAMEYDVSEHVETTTSSTTGSLTVVQGMQEDGVA
jgi:hypothetical protein